MADLETSEVIGETAFVEHADGAEREVLEALYGQQADARRSVRPAGGEEQR